MHKAIHRNNETLYNSNKTNVCCILLLNIVENILCRKKEQLYLLISISSKYLRKGSHKISRAKPTLEQFMHLVGNVSQDLLHVRKWNKIEGKFRW